jgi:uncharacterized OB-fold protein
MNQEIPLTAYRCKHCGKLHYPFHDRCLRCKQREFEIVYPQGHARLLTYTAILNIPSGFDQHPLLLGLVEFENHIKALGQIQVNSVQRLQIGMLLKPTWGPVRYQAGQVTYGLKLEPLE